MSALQVFLDIPEQLMSGLADGSLERVGGVIRQAENKQVVAWLRDDLSQHVQNPQLAQLFTAAQFSGTGLILGTVVITSLINFSVSLISLKILMNRLEQLSAQLESLRDTIKNEFKRDRDLRFKVALQAARDVFESEEVSDSDTTVRSAIDGLYEARENYINDLNLMLQSDITAERRVLAHHYLTRAMYAEVSRIRCYLNQSVDIAIRRLSEDLPRFRDLVVKMVLLWLGDKHAAYVYREMSAEHVQRFIAIKRWLSAPDDPFNLDPHTHLQHLIEELRPNFWNTEISRLFEGGGIRLLWDKPPHYQAVLVENLTQAEIIIENFQHLQGFELELRSMRLGFTDWKTAIENVSTGFAVIVDAQWLNTAHPHQE